MVVGKKALCLALCVVAMLSFGCGSSRNGGNQSVGAPEKQEYAKSDTADFDVYLDGTTSMYGYVNYPGGTVYGEAVKNIERTASENWKSEKTQFIKFGDDFKTLSRDEFLQMNQAGFYDQKDTSLQKVVEQADAKKVNVIVTDLFQTNQDIDSLMLALKKKCLTDGNALAVIGIKSQFNGKIFDIGKAMASVDYASTDDPKTFRPFYVLAFGKEGDIREFVQDYAKNLPSSAQQQVVLFSANLGVDTEMKGDAVSNGTPREKGVAELAEISNILPDSDIPQYRLKMDEKLSKADVRVFGDDVVGTLPKSYEVDVQKVESSGGKAKTGFIDKILGRGAKGDASFEEVKGTEFFTGEVTDAGLKDGNANLAVTFKVDPSAVNKKEGIYRVLFSVMPTKEAYIANNNIFDGWNIDDTQLGSDPAALAAVGSKTLNISNFIRQLSNMNYELNKPGFHNLWVYFQGK